MVQNRRICSISDDLWWEGATMPYFILLNFLWLSFLNHGTDSEVTDPSTEGQTECSPSEPISAESEANSHASSEVTDSAIDENEVQSPISRPRGPSHVLCPFTTFFPTWWKLTLEYLQVPIDPEPKTAVKVIKTLKLILPLEEPRGPAVGANPPS